VKATTKVESPPAEELRPGTDEEIRSVLDSLKAMGHQGIQMPSPRGVSEDEEPTPPEELEARRLEQLRKLEEFRKQCEGS
jgi:sugar phosphate isomerase/epimerase